MPEAVAVQGIAAMAEPLSRRPARLPARHVRLDPIPARCPFMAWQLDRRAARFEAADRGGGGADRLLEANDRRPTREADRLRRQYGCADRRVRAQRQRYSRCR